MGLAFAMACGLGGCVGAQLRRELSRADVSLLASPAMHLVLCGTGGALTDRERAGPCTAVVAGGRVYLVDVGAGATEAADLAGLPLAGLGGVLLTTFLADDIADLGELLTRSWIAGRERPLPVFGPPGTARLVGDVNDGYRYDVAMRAARHDPGALRPGVAPGEAREFALTQPDGVVTLVDADGLRISAIAVGEIAGIASVAYRFDWGGRAIVIAGHGRGRPQLPAFARGADVLVHEAANATMIRRGIDEMEALGQHRMARLSREMLRAYPTPIEAAEVARAAGVGRLVLTRLYPPPNGAFRRWVFMRGVRDVFPATVLGEDGMRLRLDPVSVGGPTPGVCCGG